MSVKSINKRRPKIAVRSISMSASINIGRVNVVMRREAESKLQTAGSIY